MHGKLTGSKVALLSLSLIGAQCTIGMPGTQPATSPVPTSGEASLATSLSSAQQTGTQGAASPTEDSRLETPVLVVEGDVNGFWWEEYPLALVYSLGDKVYDYDVVHQVASERSSLEPLSATQEATPIPGIPPEAVNVGVSPSGELILYATSRSTKPTPSSGTGEVWNRGGEVTLWLNNAGVSAPLGVIEDCVEDYQWSDDEKVALISTVSLPAPCQGPRAWLVDTVSPQLSPLIDRQDPQGDLVILALSPDGSALTYWYDAGLWLLDIPERAGRRLPMIRPRDSVWLDPSTLLVASSPTESAPPTLMTFDLASDTARIAGPERPASANNAGVARIVLSPDLRWVAYTLGASLYDIDSLWLAELLPK